jgi:AsmA protein
MQLKWKIAGAVAGVVIVGLAAIPLFIDVNTFRPVLEKELSAQLGRDVKLGEMSLALLRGDVIVHGLTMADDPKFSSTPFLTASDVHVGVEMGPLIFKKQILVRGVEIHSPKINLVRAASNVWNFSTIAQNASRNPDPQGSSIAPNLAVGKFTIDDGTITLESAPPRGAPQVLSNVQLEVDDFSFTNQFPFTFHAGLPGYALISLQGKAGPIDPRNAVNTTFDAQMTLKNFDPVAAGLLDKSAGISMLADIDAHASSDGTTVKSNGTVHAARLQLMANAEPTPKPVDITYTVAHHLPDNTGKLDDAAVETGKLSAHLTGSYNLEPATPVVTMKLVGQSLPIDELQALLPAVGVKLPTGSVLQGGTLTTNLAVNGPLNALVISGPVDVNGTRLAGYNFSAQLKGVAGLAAGNMGDITNIAKMHTDLNVTNTTRQLNNIYLSMPAIGEAVGQGSVSPQGALNFQLKLKVDTSHGVGGEAVGLLTAMNGTAGKSASQAAATGVPVTITGTTSNPVITPDVSSAVKSNVKAIFSSSSPLGSFLKKKK